jgi:hypothetical protein
VPSLSQDTLRGFKEADRSPRTRTEVMNAWSFISATHIPFNGADLRQGKMSSVYRKYKLKAKLSLHLIKYHTMKIYIAVEV